MFLRGPSACLSVQPFAVPGMLGGPLVDNVVVSYLEKASRSISVVTLRTLVFPSSIVPCCCSRWCKPCDGGECVCPMADVDGDLGTDVDYFVCPLTPMRSSWVHILVPPVACVSDIFGRCC